MSLVRPKPETEPPGKPSAPRPQRDRPLAMVVDDSPLHRTLAAGILSQCGFAVEEAEDGDEGLDKIRALKPDLVILDVLMKKVDGYVVCAELREDAATANLPILMVTALDDLDSIQRAFDVGATDFLTKPVNPTLLQYRIKYMMKGHSRDEELREAKREAEQAFETVATLSRALEEQVEDRTAQLAATQSELLDKDRQLLQSQKMEALGQLAGGIAHEFNNQLTVIGGFGRAALDNIANAERVRVSLNEIVAAADRSAALTSQMLAFSRQQMLWTKTVQVGEVIGSMREMLHSMVGETKELHIDIRDYNASTMVDPIQLSQAIINLAVNARDAISESGRLTIGSEAVELVRGARLSHHIGAIVPGRYVHLFVEDTGSGMDAAMLARIFDPFFTTKEPGRGTGLGLSVVFGIVKQCGGMIDVESTPGKGTTFSIYFPIVDELPAEVQSTSEVISAGKGETILVVEDEGSVLNLVKMSLESLGYMVLTAYDGAQAVAVLEQNAGDIDLLLTDVVMPKMGGINLGNKFSELCPNKAVVYMSGYAPELSAHLQHLGDDCHFLRKPFKPDELAGMVRDALDASAA